MIIVVQNVMKVEVPQHIIEQRIKEIIVDERFLKPLMDLIGKEHGWNSKKVSSQKNSKEFREFVRNFLKDIEHI